MNDGELTARHYASGEPMVVRWRAGVITHLASSAQPSQLDTWIAPGLFDLQVNGYGGVDFQQDDLPLADLLEATRQLRLAGCTRFLLALITNEWPRLTQRLQHLRALRAQSAELRNAIAGWHIEGPFLSEQPGFHGAHDPAYMRDPRAEDILQLRE